MVELIERFLYWAGSTLLEGDAAERVQIRNALDDCTLVTVGDDLVSMIEILGARKLVGESELEEQAYSASQILASVMRSGNGRQHSFGMAFRSSPHSVPRLLNDLIAPSEAAARSLDVHDDRLGYFEDVRNALGKVCVEERVYLVVFTHRAGLSPAEKKRALDWREEAASKAAKETRAAGGTNVRAEFGQPMRIPTPLIIPRHMSMVDGLVESLSADSRSRGAGLIVRKVDAAEALTLMRRQIDASDFDHSWRPALHGERRASYGVAAPRKADQSHLMPPPLARQVISTGYKEIFSDAELAKCGSIYYASMMMEVPPETGRGRFGWLAARIGRVIPWTYSIEVTPNGAKSRQVDQIYAGFLGGFGDHNKRVKAAWDDLRSRANSGEYVVAVRVTVMTWGGSEREAIDNLSFLRTSLESWESAVVSNECGEPALLAMTAATGLLKRSPAPYMPGPLGELVHMMPLFRPASIWTNGQLNAHTRDGRPYPVAFGSSRQSFWGVLGFAPSGSGKSFTLSQINFGILTAPGIRDVPPLVVIDVGPGSSYVMKLVQSMLPERLRPKVGWLRIRNDKDHTVNPFDTQLGCDAPTEVDRDFLVSVLATVAPNLGVEGDKFCSQVILEAYRRFARNSPECRTWQESFDPPLHQHLIEAGFAFRDVTRVWDVEDWLFDRGEIEWANRAHRFAMPRLSDMIQAAQSKVIVDQYGGAEPARTPNGEPLINVFMRNVTAAQSDYALISGYTRFDAGSARAIAIDLEEVVGSISSEEGRRRSAIMFLFARRLGARNFFLRWDEIRKLVPQRYSAFHERRCLEMEASLKFLEYDEKHYTTGVASVDRQIEVDLRVGRKYKVVTMMFSQNIEDFNDAMVNNCYTYLIMGKGTSEESEKLRRRFGLSDSEIQAIERDCIKPGRMFGYFKTDMGDTSQILHTTAGAFAQWAFTTSKDDVLLRNEVERQVGFYDSVRLLSQVLPRGTVRRELEIYRQRHAAQATDNRTEAEIFCEKVLETARTPGRQIGY
jgi:intracellular multiplication protein IcmB